MTEDEMKAKKCPYHSTAAALLMIEAVKLGNVNKEEGETIADAGRCSGSGCAIWIPSGYTDSEDRYCNANKKGAVPVGEGDCGLKTK